MKLKIFHDYFTCYSFKNLIFGHEILEALLDFCMLYCKFYMKEEIMLFPSLEYSLFSFPHAT